MKTMKLFLIHFKLMHLFLSINFCSIILYIYKMNFLQNFFGWNNNQAQDRPLFGMVIRNRTDQEPDNISLFALPNNKIASIHDNCKIITIIESGNLQIKQDYIIKHKATSSSIAD